MLLPGYPVQYVDSLRGGRMDVLLTDLLRHERGSTAALGTRELESRYGHSSARGIA